MLSNASRQRPSIYLFQYNENLFVLRSHLVSLESIIILVVFIANMFKRFVEAGRFCLITYGPDCGKTCVIVDIIDGTKVIIDGPKDLNGMLSYFTSRTFVSVGVERQQIPIRWLSMTDFKVEIGRAACSRVVKAAVEKAGVVEAFKKTTWAKKVAAREAKKNLTDFERFRVMVAKKRTNHAINTEVNKVKKTVSKRK